jgi:hypothetical protein
MKKHLPTIDVTIVPHKAQIYDTAGNYGADSIGWWFEISKMEDWRYEAMVMIHEMVERVLCEDRGIKLKDIDFFDIEGEGAGHPDPGTLKTAPYHKEHMIATKVEKMLCKEFGIDWETYDSSFEQLKWR